MKAPAWTLPTLRTYDKNSRGHKGGWSGTIKNVTRVRELTSHEEWEKQHDEWKRQLEERKGQEEDQTS